MSPGHLSARIFDLFEALRSFKDHHKAREILMTALAHLTAAVEQSAAKLTEKDARIADLQKQLDDAKAAPAAGATDAQLDDLTSKLEAIIGAVTDPSTDPSTGAPGPVVGTTATTVTDPSTGNITTVDHGTGQASTIDSGGAAVATDPVAAQAAIQAAQAAGVVVPPTV